MASELSSGQQKRMAYRQFVGLGIYMICGGGASGMTTLYVYMAEQYGCSVTMAVIGVSICNIVAFITGQLFVGGFIVRHGARKSMVISLLGVAAGFTIMAFAPNIYVAYIGFACSGLVYSFGLTVPVGTMVRTWWHERQGTILGSVLGLAGVGTALWPALAGILLETFGLSKMLLIYTPLFAVPGLLDVIFVLKDSPESVGMKPIGWEEDDEPAPASAAAPTQTASGPSVYARPLFWFCAVVLFIQVITQSAASLLPTALQTAGMAVGMASTMCSISNIVAIPGNMFTGWLRDKVGYTGFIVFSFVAFILSSVCFIVWMQVSPGSVMGIYLWLSMIGQGLSRAMLYMPAHTSGLLFPDCADVAQARLQSLVSLGGAVILPMVSSFAESAGSYLPVAYLWIAAAAVCGIAWVAAVQLHARKS